MRALLAIALVFFAGACSAQPADRADRCATVNTRFSECAGRTSPVLDCTTASAAEIDRLDEATATGACTVLASAIPLDGDPKSATCRLFGVGCVKATNEPIAHEPTRFPILLVNGIDSSPLFRWSDRIVRVMRDEGGHDVHFATLTPYEPPRRRAPELWKRIEEVRKQTGAEKVNLLCHSLGGLDCRYLASEGGAHWELGVPHAAIVASIASITTVGTAHRGTPVADASLGLMPDGDGAKTIDALATIAGDWFTKERIASDVHLKEALTALSVANAPAFNAEIVDAEGIHYQSWAGVSRPFGRTSPEHDAEVARLCGSPIARTDWMSLTLAPFEGTIGAEPNDGLATVSSAKWGEFRGCIPADHMEQLGQRNLPDANVQTGLDIARFYASVATDLARRGF